MLSPASNISAATVQGTDSSKGRWGRRAARSPPLLLGRQPHRPPPLGSFLQSQAQGSPATALLCIFPNEVQTRVHGKLYANVCSSSVLRCQSWEQLRETLLEVARATVDPYSDERTFVIKAPKKIKIKKPRRSLTCRLLSERSLWKRLHAV